jgi:hypothetical protein
MPYKDPEKARECARRTYLRNRDKVLAWQREYYKNNRDHVRAIKRRSAEKCAERYTLPERLELYRKHQQRYREKRAAQARAYRREHRDEAVIRKRLWTERNREYVAEYARLRREAMLALDIPAPRNNQWWTADEDDELRSDKSDIHLAYKLGRTVDSVRQRRTKINRIDPTYADVFKPELRQCHSCDEEYLARRRGCRYCSRACFAASQTIRPPVKCPICGTTFKPRKAPKGWTRFCSTRCGGVHRRKRPNADLAQAAREILRESEIWLEKHARRLAA